MEMQDNLPPIYIFSIKVSIEFISSKPTLSNINCSKLLINSAVKLLIKLE